MNTNTNTNTNMQITREQIKKLSDTIDAGLVKGLGVPTPGRMCIEAAVCYALGLPHGDDPICVDAVFRSFKLTLNDANWGSDIDRAKGLKKLGVAQLNSRGNIDSILLVQRLVEETNQRILVPLLEELGYKKQAISLGEIKTAAADAVAYAAAAAAAAATYAAAAAIAADAAATYDAAAATYAIAAAIAAAAAAADAAADAATATNNTNYLQISANLALDILIELKAPGILYLDWI